MKPYYTDESVTIYHGDCRDILPSIGKVDLVLTDPPFFLPAAHYQSRVKWQRTYGDLTPLIVYWEVMTRALVAVLKTTGSMFVFCDGDSYPPFYQAMYGAFDGLDCLVWDKANVGLGRIFRHQHELVLWGRYTTSFGDCRGRLISDVLRHKATPSSERGHPVQKPAELLGALLEPTTSEKATVLDPFTGSGTTLEAAKKLGRKAIGIEIEEKYCEIAANRCRQMVLL